MAAITKPNGFVFKCLTYHSLSGWPEFSYLLGSLAAAPLCLSFPSWKVEIITVPTSGR